MLDENAGLLAVKRNNKYGCINLTCEEVIAIMYDTISWTYIENAIYVKVDGKCGWLNVKGEEMISIIYDDVSELACPKDIVVVERDNKCGLVNYQGEILLPLIYDSIRMDGNARLVRVERNHEWGCIDLSVI